MTVKTSTIFQTPKISGICPIVLQEFDAVSTVNQVTRSVMKLMMQLIMQLIMRSQMDQ